jgi:hypothetical protein
MSVPFQCTSRCRRLRRSVETAIMVPLIIVLTGIYVNLPPPLPPGRNPDKPNKWKKCPRCKKPVLPPPHGHCVCDYCFKKFEAADAKDYS